MVDQSRDQPLLATGRKLSLSFNPVVSASTGFNFNTDIQTYRKWLLNVLSDVKNSHFGQSIRCRHNQLTKKSSNIQNVKTNNCDLHSIDNQLMFSQRIWSCLKMQVITFFAWKHRHWKHILFQVLLVEILSMASSFSGHSRILSNGWEANQDQLVGRKILKQ